MLSILGLMFRGMLNDFISSF